MALVDIHLRSPHLCVWFLKFLVLILYPPSASPSLSHTTLSPTIFHTQLCHPPSFTHNFVTHHLSHPIFHTQLCHTPCFTHHLCHTHTHHLSHTTLSHTIFDTPLCHRPSFTHNFVKHHFVTHHLSHAPSLSHTIFHTPSFTHTTLSHTIFQTPSLSHTYTHHLSHTTLSHTIFHHHLSPHHLSHTTLSHTHTIFLRHTPSFTYNFITQNFVLLLDPRLHHLLCLSFLPRPGYNIWCSLLEEVALWGYPVLKFTRQLGDYMIQSSNIEPAKKLDLTTKTVKKEHCIPDVCPPQMPHIL